MNDEEMISLSPIFIEKMMSIIDRQHKIIKFQSFMMVLMGIVLISIDVLILWGYFK